MDHNYAHQSVSPPTIPPRSAPATLLHVSTILLRSRHRAVAPRRRSIVQCLDICAPLIRIRPQHAAVVRQQAVDFALNICSLRPDAAGASVLLDLVAEFGQQEVGAVVVGVVCLVDFVGLVYCVDCLLDVPEAMAGKRKRLVWFLRDS
jgi:hypothetical protein